MATPPFTIATTTPADNDLISVFPGQERPYRDVVWSWLNFLSDPTTGLLKSTSFTFPFVITNSGIGNFFQLESTDAGALEGPSINLYRNSASPAANDLMGVVRWSGKDSAGNIQDYGHIRIDLDDPVSGTEDSSFHQVIVVAGVPTERIVANASGVVLGGTLSYSGAIAGLTGTGTLTSGAIGGSFGAINIGANTLTAGAGTFSGSVSSAGSVSATSFGSFSGGLFSTFGAFSASITAVNGTFSGNVQTGQNIISPTAALVLGATGAGTIYQRPNGVGSATGQFTVASNGNANSSGDITASSDRRLKKSIAPLNHMWAWDMVSEVEPKSFIRRKSDTRSLGFIAQDVEGYAPELVGTDPRGYRTLAYPNMVAILWAVVQDLQKKVTELETK